MKNLAFPGIVSLFLFLSIPILAQHNNSELPTSIRADGAAPDSSAVFEVQDSTRGVLISRMDSIQRVSIPDPATGLLVYQTDKEAGYYYFDGNNWIPVHGELNAFSLLGYEPVADRSCLAVIGSLGIGPNPISVAVSGDYAYVVDWGSDDLKVIDLSDPAAPSLIGSLGIGPNPRRVAVSGDYAYVVDQSSNDLKVIDVSNPAAPSLSGSLGIGTSPWSIAVQGDYAYVVDGASDDLKVIDVSDPAAPALTGSLGIGPIPYSVAVSGDYAYVVDQSSDDLKVIDVSDPAAPSLSGSLGLGPLPYSVAVSGDYAYVVDPESDDLKVIDVINPATPALIGSLGLGPTPISLAVSGNWAYVLDVQDRNLDVIDVRNPTNPQLKGNLVFGINPTNIAVSGNYVYVLDHVSDDMKVIDVSPCGNPSLGIDPMTGDVVEGPLPLWENDGLDIISKNQVMTLVDSGSVQIGSWQSGKSGGQTMTNPQLLLSGKPNRGSNKTGYKLLIEGYDNDDSIHTYPIYCRDENGKVDFYLRSRYPSGGRSVAYFQGSVGIRTQTPAHPLHMGSGAHVTTSGVWTNVSDISLKSGIEPIHYGLSEIMQLNPSAYQYKTDNSPSIGFVAQEMEQVIPEVVSGEEGQKGIGYGLLTAVITRAIQELNLTIEQQQAIIEKQQEQIEWLMSQFEEVDQ